MKPLLRRLANSGVDALAARIRRLVRVRRIKFDGLDLVGYRDDIPKAITHRLNYGTHETPERLAVAKYVRPDDRVIEIGSCVGVLAMMAAQKVGAANVWAFEPNPGAASVARENFRRNGFDIRLDEAAVGAVEGHARLWIGEKDWLGARLDTQGPGGTEVTVKVVAAEAIVSSFRPTLLIIDAEGMEAEILKACPLDGIRCIIAEMHPAGGGDDPLPSLRRHLSQHGFSLADSWSPPDGEDTTTEAWVRK